mmetsp:Transcript_42217/g.55618  ORF Transcript_42217/g.55618 Transcript_42217/m.55618 type:complete len:85 (-) Transcript_42217:1042-1296(-)
MRNCSEHKAQQSCLIVSGDAIHAIMYDTTLKDMFLRIIKDCKSLISCRMSPKQKSDLVKFMKEFNRDKTVLSVGDGANDVAMIT